MAQRQLLMIVISSIALPVVTAAQPAHLADPAMKSDCGQEVSCAEKFADALSSHAAKPVRLDALVTFAPGSARVYSESREQLQLLATAWRKQPRWSMITVEGYAGRGSSAALALQRADKIRSYLVRYGVAADYVAAIPGIQLADDPAADANTGRVDLAVEVCDRGPSECPRMHATQVAR
jgi:outer membrane protein OmpA-like peptidoglycan-associated protein